MEGIGPGGDRSPDPYFFGDDTEFFFFWMFNLTLGFPPKISAAAGFF